MDYGCGTGVLFPELLKENWQIVGLDLSYEMLTHCKNYSDQVFLTCSDGCQTPFADGSFDCIICRGSIHHLPDLKKSFEEIFRILKNSGVLVFSEPSNDSLINRIARRIMYRSSEEFHDEDEGFIRDEIIPLLNGVGFDIEKSRGFGFFAYTLAGFPDKLSILKKIPGNIFITRLLILLDRFLESLPLVNRLALHWQVCAKKSAKKP
jgi:SAM-dependent methyltransferase